MDHATSSRSKTLITLTCCIFILALWIPVQASEAEITPTLEPTTEIILQTEEPTEIIVENTEVPTVEIPVEPTEEIPSTVVPPTEQPTIEPTVEQPTVEPIIEQPTRQPRDGREGGNVVKPEDFQTYCQMNISDAGDDNPFTFAFSAPVAHNIASFAWDFGDTNTANTQNANHTYTQTGSFPITLVCTPQAGYGAPMTLTGGVTISSVVVADFELTPATVLTGLPPFVISTVNKSQGGGLIYSWKISTSSNPADPGFYANTTQNISYTFTAADITAYPAIFYFHLLVTDGANSSAYARESVVFNAPPPNATFNVTPSSGTAPLNVTVLGEDLNEGPITTWEWDFNNDAVVDATGIGPHNYSYPTPGTYPIKLRYIGPGGSGTVTRTVVASPAVDPVQALFTYELTGAGVGGIEVCFTNNSTGPVATSQWDFNGDGTYDLVSNDKIVCHTYPSEAVVTVRLRVEDAGAGSTSTATEAVNLISAPIAAFTVTPGVNITWGTLINLNDTSTGVIDTWAWDYDGDGTTDSTTQNPTGISLTQLGANPIRLTVTGPGGTSFVELVVMVARLEITCDFNGTFNVLPGAGAQTYTSVIGNQSGRPITYNWTVTGTGAGLPLAFSTPNITVDWSSIGYGAFQVTLEASTADGSICNVTKTINRAWAALDCQMSDNLPGTLYANGNTYTFNANVSNLNGRSAAYQWYVDGAAAGTGTSLNWTNTTSTASLPASVTVRYEVTVDNGVGYTPATSTCFEEKTFTIQPWPDLVCQTLAGTTAVLPGTPDNTGRNYTYTANINGVAGRPVSYAWTVSDGIINSANPSTVNTANVTWNATAGTFPPAANDDNISVVVTVTNPDGTTDVCNMGSAIGVYYNHLVCNMPGGDMNPVVAETVNYTRNVANRYGRPWAAVNPLVWEIEQLTPTTNAWTSDDNPFAFSFPEAGATYRIRYSAAVDTAGNIPADACMSNWYDITVYGEGLLFECEGNLTGNAAPAGAGPFTYSIDMDNGNGINLLYTWELEDYTGTRHLLGTPTSVADGIINSPAFTLAQLGPLGADNYTLHLTVRAVDQTVTNYSCTKQIALTVGTINVDYTFNAGGWTATAVPVNQPICLTNVSTVTPGSIDTLNYTWTVSGDPANNSWGVSTSTDQQPGSCISFSVPGVYTINLQGVTDSGLRNGSRIRTFNVYGLQSILINRSGSQFAPSTQNFTATGTNITGSYNWEFRRISDNALIGTRTGANVNQNFTTAGAYRATVSGTGPLGITTAQLEFTLLPTGGLTAAFTASQYGGIAPMEVCFTDKSISGGPILTWEWDFDGDGTFESVYNGSLPANLCYEYTVPGMVYNVSLRVTNASFTDTATNRIRTYNALESSATFAIQPQATAARFCFVPQVSANVIVTGWDFGDGSTDPSSGTVCHTYSASGVYTVEMHITDGVTTGIVIRIVIIDLTGGTPPDLVASASCSPDVRATFTITNNGGAMTTPDQVTIRDEAGNVILIAPLQLAGGASTSFTVVGYVGDVTLSTTDIVLTTTTDCAQPPLLSISHTCQINGSVIFTITNSGVETAASQPYQIVNASNTVVASGMLNVAVQSSAQITVNGPHSWGALTFQSSGIQGPTTVISDTSDCDAPPHLDITHTCQLDGSVIFTITNSSPAETAANQPYEIRDAANALVTSGTLVIPVGGSQTVTVNGPHSWGALTFTSSGTQGDTTVISDTSDCAQPPILGIGHSCAIDGVVTFTITNTSAESASNQPYEVRDAANAVVQSGMLTVGINNSATVVVGGPDSWEALTFVSSGVEGVTTVLNDASDCIKPPLLSVTNTCLYDGTAQFTVTNGSDETAANQPYDVRNASGAIVSIGTLSVPMMGTRDILAPNAWGPLTFSSTGTQGTTTSVTSGSNCTEPPILVGSAICKAGAAVFTIENRSTMSATTQNYTVYDRTDSVVQTGVLDLPAGGSQQVTVSGQQGIVRLVSNGSAGVTTNIVLSTVCASATGVLSGSMVCNSDGSVSFIITNEGQTTVNQTYTVTGEDGSIVLSGTLNLAAGDEQIITAAKTEKTGALTFNTTGADASTTLTMNADCGATSFNDNDDKTGDGDGNTHDDDGGDQTVSLIRQTPRHLPPMTLTPGGVDAALVDRPTWEGLAMGEAVCPDWLIYHTNMTGDWEIFRLGDGNDARLAQYDPNLSQGEGKDVTDMAPTRSPDGEWIAFTSNRDSDFVNNVENWELYVSRVDNTVIRRMTYNTTAKDIDPVWSPDGRYVAFETDRDGNWELYLFDVTTGAEIRLTDHAASDINAFWSPDSQQIVFQSDRDGNWQLYLMDVATREIIKLSDGLTEDHDPAFSFDGKRIAFRAYTLGSGISAIYLMNSDGTGKQMISNPTGSASNHTWSPDDSVIAYQSDLDGDLDIYVYEVEKAETRLVTDNTIMDYAPTWICDAPIVVFTSDVMGDANIFNTPALPIKAPAILVDKEANRMTFSEFSDVYPENSPSEENASREGNVPPKIGMDITATR